MKKIIVAALMVLLVPSCRSVKSTQDYIEQKFITVTYEGTRLRERWINGKETFVTIYLYKEVDGGSVYGQPEPLDSLMIIGSFHRMYVPQ